HDGIRQMFRIIEFARKPPSCRAAELPGRRATGPPGHRAAGPPGRRATGSPAHRPPGPANTCEMTFGGQHSPRAG
ncbi:hypothetical protein ACFWMJ_41605, partial [Streptomyces hawaiiensis]|uniref:hypothetical protein n=1 Tax=Streptomyces hawaiiensis TaxID=67305 RepID=UPI003660DE2A